MAKKLNPKKHPEARRVRPNREPVKQYQVPKPVRICKECMFRPARQGSAYCVECAADYHNKKNK